MTGGQVGPRVWRAVRWQVVVAVTGWTGVVWWSAQPATAAVALGVVAVGVARSSAVVRWCRRIGRAIVRPWSKVDQAGPTVAVATGPVSSGTVEVPPVDLVFRDGRLIVMMEIRPAAGAPPPDADDARLLTPLLATAGVAVDAIQWLQAAAATASADLPHGGGGARTLVAFVIDPARNARAVGARGGGEDGTRRLVAVTVTRAAALLATRGLRPRVLDGAQTCAVLTGSGAAPGVPVDRAPGRQSTTQEGRRDLRRDGRHHRLLRWAPGPDVAASAAARPTLDSAAPYRPPAIVGATVVRSQWIRAGPGGVQRTGVVRLSASRPGDLAVLERSVRRDLDGADGHRSPPRASRALRVGVDEQWPLYLTTRPGGGR